MICKLRIDHQRSVRGSFFRRGVGRKCREGSKRRARTRCKSHQGRYAEAGIDHQWSVQGSFFLRGVRRKFEERASYILRFHGRYAEAGIDHQRSVQGSFVRRGRRKKVPGKGHLHMELHCRRCWCPLLSLCHHRCTSRHPAKQGTCLHLVSSGKFLPPGA